MSKVIDLTGLKFGKLTVLKRAGSKTNRATWLCRCECGTECVVYGYSLRNGNTRSCGCYSIEKTRERFTKHGDRRNHKQSRLYGIWEAMKKRCYDQAHAFFYNYGNRGISVCSEWKNDFETFKEWAVNNGYNENLTLDRIDNNGNYEPANCRWVTMKAQQNHRRNNFVVSIDGVSKTVQEWADETGMKYHTLYRRLKHGWMPKDAVNMPVRVGGENK